jgi:hypothetical protein
MELRVRATIGMEPGTVVGYYPSDPKKGKRRREGEEFELESPEHFSHRWMEALGWEPPPPSGQLLPPPGAQTAAFLSEQQSFTDDEDDPEEKKRQRARDRRRRKKESQVPPEPTEG